MIQIIRKIQRILMLIKIHKAQVLPNLQMKAQNKGKIVRRDRDLEAKIQEKEKSFIFKVLNFL